MPSPPDVILVLSPRMARLVVHLIPPGITYEEAEAGGYTSTDEAAKALDAFCAEVETQLARTLVRDSLLTAVGEDVVQTGEPAQSPAAEVADKMAKSARKAVESNDTDTADGLGSGGLVTGQDLDDLAAEGDRSPGVVPPDSEVQ